MRNVRYTIDPLNIGEKEVLYYADRDLQIGTVLNVYGRAVVLTDCDEYTQEYYRKRVCNTSAYTDICTHFLNSFALPFHDHFSMVLRTLLRHQYRHVATIVRRLNKRNAYCHPIMAGVHMRIPRAIASQSNPNRRKLILRNSSNWIVTCLGLALNYYRPYVRIVNAFSLYPITYPMIPYKYLRLPNVIPVSWVANL